MDKGKARGIGCLMVIVVLGLVWVVSLFIEPKPKFIRMEGLDNFAMIVPPKADAGAIKLAIDERCAAKQFCTVLGWTDESNAARSLPLLDQQQAALAFRYDLNLNSGLEAMLWDCRRFKRAAKEECLAP